MEIHQAMAKPQHYPKTTMEQTNAEVGLADQLYGVVSLICIPVNMR